MLGIAASELTGGLSNLGGVQLQEEAYAAEAKARGTADFTSPS